MPVNYVEDAEKFVEEAKEEDFSEMSKRDVQKWFFRLKKDLEGRYNFDVHGFEDDYEAVLESEDGVAELVIDRKKDEVEVGGLVVEDGETLFKDVSRRKD